MGPINREKVELRQFRERFNRNPDEYFKRFDKRLPTNLTEDDTVLLYKIDNFEVIKRIIDRNPRARYTGFGNKGVNDALKLMNDDFKNIVAYHNSTTRFKDKKAFDHTAYTYSIFETSPESSSPMDFLKIGLKVGQKLSLISVDGKKEYVSWTVYDGRHMKDETGRIAALGSFIKEFIRKTKLFGSNKCDGYYVDRKIFKHGICRYADIYPAYAMVDQTYSVHDYFTNWLETRCVIKN